MDNQGGRNPSWGEGGNMNVCPSANATTKLPKKLRVHLCETLGRVYKKQSIGSLRSSGSEIFRSTCLSRRAVLTFGRWRLRGGHLDLLGRGVRQ